MKSVLVTGGSGFLGRFVLQELLTRNFLVISIDICPCSLSHANLETHVFDFRQMEKLRQVSSTHNVQAIIHIASLVDVRVFPSSDIFSVNVEGTQKLVDFCLDMNIPSFILISSMDAGYTWDGNHFSSEKDLPICVDKTFAYGISKRKQEEIVLKALCGNNNLKATVLRSTHLFGPGDDLINIPWYVGIGGGLIGLLSVQNAAESIVNALEKIEQCNGHIIYLQDTKENIASFYSARMGTPCILIPRSVLYIFAWIFECLIILFYQIFKINLERHHKFVFSTYSVTQAGKHFYYDNSLSIKLGIYKPSKPLADRIQSFEEWIKKKS